MCVQNICVLCSWDCSVSDLKMYQELHVLSCLCDSVTHKHRCTSVGVSDITESMD